MKAKSALFVAIACLGLTASTGCIVTPHRRVVVGVTAPATAQIATTGVYWCYDLDGDYFYYRGYWYWCDGPYWYRTRSWGGTWVHVSSPPPAFLYIPSNHRAHTVVYRHPSHPRYRSHRQKYYVQYRQPSRSRSYAEVRRRTGPARPPSGPSMRDKVKDPGRGGGSYGGKVQTGGRGGRGRTPPPKKGIIKDPRKKTPPRPPPKKGIKDKKDKKPPPPRKKEKGLKGKIKP